MIGNVDMRTGVKHTAARDGADIASERAWQAALAAQQAERVDARKALAARERLLDALAAGDEPDPDDRKDFRDNRGQIPGRGAR